MMLFLEMINLPSGQEKNLKKIKYTGGKGITNPMRYEHWASLHRINKRVWMLKKDLERDCKAYWKYDDLAKDIEDLQKAIIIEDELEQLK